MNKTQRHNTTVGVIGGKGLMGSFFVKVFKELGFRVIVSDIKTKLTNTELVKRSDIVLFSVPIIDTQRVISSVRKYIRDDQLLLDVTSIKSLPVKEMLKSPAEVIGLHPMFRPNPMGLKNQSIVLCRGRAKISTVKEVSSWFTSLGAKVVPMTARAHDKLMSIIQVLLHFHTMVLAHTMRDLGVPIRKTLKAASPIYRLEMDMIGRIFSQDPFLYGPIEMLNPETKRVIKKLEKNTKKLSGIVLKKDIESFVKEFNKTSHFLGSYKKEALEEINRLLTHL